MHAIATLSTPAAVQGTPALVQEHSRGSKWWQLALLLCLAAGCGDDNNGTSSAVDPGTESEPLVIDALGLEFVYVDPGTFRMGSPSTEPERRDDEGPQHDVTITWGYWMGKYEITQAQWEAAMGTRPWEEHDYVIAEPQRPAVYVSWPDAAEFLQRLNMAAGQEIYFMPTEAEWEFACRGGTRTAWSFGDDPAGLDDAGWYAGNAWDVELQAAQPVGQKAANPFGLCDCHGNVWEWVYDIYGAHTDSSQTDPGGALNGAHNVIRGGSFYYFATDTRSAARSFNFHEHQDSNLGFRIMRIATADD
jgi:formylglycine-generating enzyme required for sulfatase activity